MNKISSSLSVFEEVKKHFDDYQEKFILIGLNNNNEVLFNKILFLGGVNNTQVDKRIIFHKLLIKKCSNFFIAHNHPTKNITPSCEDDKITTNLKECGELLNIKLLDHIIFSNEKYYSYFDEDKL